MMMLDMVATAEIRAAPRQGRKNGLHTHTKILGILTGAWEAPFWLPYNPQEANLCKLTHYLSVY